MLLKTIHDKIIRTVFLVIIFLGGKQNCHAEIIKADNFATLQHEVMKSVSKDCLVLFDVDDVLISPTDEFNFRSEIRKDLKKEISKSKSKHEVEVIFSDFFLKRKVQLVNKNMPILLEFLRVKKIPVSALSAWWTGNFGTIQEIEKQRLKELEQVKISFVDLSPFNKDMSLVSHKIKNSGRPIIISGIILTGLGDKGEALGLALKSIDIKFKRIIFIDDQKKYLEEIESFCAQNGLDFIGIHYTESSLAPIPEFDSDKEMRRFNILKEKHVWLSDSELEESS
jgi:hypothetical protein